MNIETEQQNDIPMTTGQRLRQARETLGLSQQMVAQHLCLMLSTVKAIEEDSLSPQLASTFSRGYLKSYAKLVHLSEEDVLVDEGQQQKSMLDIVPLQSFSFEKQSKKRDRWLMWLTWLILLGVAGLTGIWWWQNYKVQQQEIISMAEQSSEIHGADPAEATTTGSLPSSGGTVNNSTVQPAGLQPSIVSSSTVQPSVIQSSTTSLPAPSTAQPPVATQSAAASTEVNPALPAVVSPSSVATVSPVEQPTENITKPASMPETALRAAAIQAQSPSVSNNAEAVGPISDALQIDFIADCWLEVKDAAGKVLISKLQRGGSSLQLEGQPPYSLRLGVPSAVRIQYQNKPINISDVDPKQVARLTVPR